MADSDYETRFGGIGRLYGASALSRFRRAHVCIIGVGGVGSWVVEALARSGIGAMTLVDLDDVCVSNVNRQLPALDPHFGRPKVEVLAERVQAINPQCKITTLQIFFTAETAAEILATPFDYVVDAIDSVSNKTLLITACRARSLPVVVAGSAGGRRDPTALRVDDLARASNDPLLKIVRKKLRSEHGFPDALQKRMGVECVYSPEPVVFPQKDGSVCPMRDPDSDLKLTCEGGYGTATHLTGAFGFVLASVVLRRLAEAA